jgi:hypothetical protein
VQADPGELQGPGNRLFQMSGIGQNFPLSWFETKFNR